MPRLNNLNFIFKEPRSSAKSPQFPPLEEPSAEQILPLPNHQLEPSGLEEDVSEQIVASEDCAGFNGVGAKVGEWSESQDMKLNELHNQLGNKWSLISQNFQGKSDNCVKNHFFSRLRMALRHLNKLFKGSKKVKPAKQHIILKITSTCEERFNPKSEYTQFFIDFSYQLKNSIFSVLSTRPNTADSQSILQKIHQFYRLYKSRSNILKNPKTSKKAKIEKEGNEEEGLSTVLSDVRVNWEVQISFAAEVQEVTIKQDLITPDALLQESAPISRIFRQERKEKINIRCYLQSDYLFDESNEANEANEADEWDACLANEWDNKWDACLTFE